MQTLEDMCKVQILGGNMVRPKVSYLPSEHQTYTVGGKKVAGASTIAGRDIDGKQVLIGWANKMGLKGVDTNAFLKHSANIGTMAHKGVECNLSGLSPSECLNVIMETYSDHANYNLYMDYCGYCYEKFLNWQRDTSAFKPITTEIALTSQELAFGGTIDIYGQLGDKKVLIDIKTSSYVYKSHYLQVAGYKNLLEWNNYPVDEVYILQISRDADKPYHFERVKAIDYYFAEFKGLVAGLAAHKATISYKKTKVCKEEQATHDAWLAQLREE